MSRIQILHAQATEVAKAAHFIKGVAGEAFYTHNEVAARAYRTAAEVTFSHAKYLCDEAIRLTKAGG